MLTGQGIQCNVRLTNDLLLQTNHLGRQTNDQSNCAQLTLTS